MSEAIVSFYTEGPTKQPTYRVVVTGDNYVVSVAEKARAVLWSHGIKTEGFGSQGSDSLVIVDLFDAPAYNQAYAPTRPYPSDPHYWRNNDLAPAWYTRYTGIPAAGDPAPVMTEPVYVEPVVQAAPALIGGPLPLTGITEEEAVAIGDVDLNLAPDADGIVRGVNFNVVMNYSFSRTNHRLSRRQWDYLRSVVPPRDLWDGDPNGIVHDLETGDLNYTMRSL